jgi:hypothetical protein
MMRQPRGCLSGTVVGRAHRPARPRLMCGGPFVRIRQIKPAFWADAKIADLSEGTRLFYIGLWGYADDAGWLRWDPREVSRELYGYEQPRHREARSSRMFAELVAAKRVFLHDCGHAELPRLTEHQHLAGTTRQVKTIYNEHTKCLSRQSPQLPAEPREAPLFPAPVRLVKDVVSQGTSSKGLSKIEFPPFEEVVKPA